MNLQGGTSEEMGDIPTTPTDVQRELERLRTEFTELMEFVRLAEHNRVPPQNTSGTSGQDMSGSGTMNNSLKNQVWKIPKPNYYLGARDSIKLGIWLTRMKTYLTISATPLQYQVTVAAAYLAGNAYTWYVTVSPEWNTNDHGYVPWDFFEQALNANFLPTNAEQQHWNQWHELRQEHSVDAYISRFRQLKILLNITPQSALDKFIRGLKQKVKEQVVLRNVTTIEEAIQLAASYDEIQRQFNPPGGKFYNRSKQNRPRFGAWASEKKDEEVFEDTRGTPMILDTIVKKGISRNDEKAFSGKCFHCGIVGHKKSECRKFKMGQGKFPAKNRLSQ